MFSFTTEKCGQKRGVDLPREILSQDKRKKQLLLHPAIFVRMLPCSRVSSWERTRVDFRPLA